MYKKLRYRLGLVQYPLLLIALIFTACSEQNEEANEETIDSNLNIITVDLSAFEAKNGTIENLENGISMSGDDSWLAYEINVPTAGRYQVVLKAISKDSVSKVWIEDYYDNEYDRTYNITSNMAINDSENGQYQDIIKDGSPMNSGLHKIKLHLGSGNVSVQGLEFHLLKTHQVTPKNMVQKVDGEEWQVVWSDEFEVEGLPDTSKWTYDIGNWGWGNGELQYYTEARSENARIENGNLIIEARKNDMGNEWTSARLTTRGKVSFTYGRIEFRAMVPPNKGNWAAGWTLGDDYVDELSWPFCGEIDILESVGYEMNDSTGLGLAHASAHCGAYYFKLGNQPTGITPVENMHEEFHTYAIDWTPEGMTATVDGRAYFTYDDTSTELSWPFNKGQNIILNLAMGGGWGGLEGMDESVSSQKMILDYVRVYEKR